MLQANTTEEARNEFGRLNSWSWTAQVLPALFYYICDEEVRKMALPAQVSRPDGKSSRDIAGCLLCQPCDCVPSPTGPRETRLSCSGLWIRLGLPACLPARLPACPSAINVPLKRCSPLYVAMGGSQDKGLSENSMATAL